MLKKFKFICAGILIIFVIIVTNTLGFVKLSSMVELLVAPILAVTYLIKAKVKPFNFTLFMILYSSGDFIWLTGIEAIFGIFYYITNGLFILGYLFLLIEIFKNINFKSVFTSHKFEFFVLLGLFIYMLYVLIKIVKPATHVTDYKLPVQILELIYNFVLLLLLTSSVLYYIQETSKKNLVFFIGCAVLVFSELLLIGYYYMVDDIRLSYISSLLYISGFLLLYYQTQLKTEGRPFISN